MSEEFLVGDYELELNKIKQKIQEFKPKKVIIQIPDGMKQHATNIVRKIQEKTGVKPHIWLGSNYGSCDIPSQLKDRYDLLLHFGHSPWIFKKGITPTYEVIE